MASARQGSRSSKLTQDEFRAIIDRANAGDLHSLRQLQQILDERPEIWQSIGDLAKNAELAMIRLISGKSVLLREAMERSLKALRNNISPADPSPLEKLLVDRIVITWMRVQYIETNSVSLADLSLAEKKFALQQRESAQKLFDAAVKSLRTVQSKLGQLPGPSSSPSPSQVKHAAGGLRVVRAAV
jgi:hypothetical protein